MLIFELSKTLMCELHYVATQHCFSQTVIVACMKLKLKMSIKTLRTIKKCNYWTNLSKLVVSKMKDETNSWCWDWRFVGLKPKMYLNFVNDNREHKKGKDVNKKNFCDNKSLWK